MRIHFALAATLLASASFAQTEGSGVAQLKGVKGNVLLSRDAGLVAGGESTRVIDHTRVITTANSEVVVVFDNGCEVRLKENQRVEIDSRKTCAVLLAEVQSLLLPAQSAGSFWAVVPPLGGIAIGVAALSHGSDHTPPLSPS